MVLSGNLGAGEVEIMIYHLEGGMTEDLPERRYHRHFSSVSSAIVSSPFPFFLGRMKSQLVDLPCFSPVHLAKQAIVLS